MSVPRRLELAPVLALSLASIWEDTRPLGILREVLLDTERALGSVVPDDVLGLLIARGQIPGKLVELSAERREHAEATFSRAVARETRSALVVIESWGDWPRFSLGFRPTQVRTPPVLLVWDWKSWTVWEEHPVRSVEAFAERLATGLEEPWLEGARPASVVTEERLAAFVPALVDPPPRVERFVQHPKFGRGRVLSEKEGVLEIAFEQHGTRKLLSRFVTPA